LVQQKKKEEDTEEDKHRTADGGGGAERMEDEHRWRMERTEREVRMSALVQEARRRAELARAERKRELESCGGVYAICSGDSREAKRKKQNKVSADASRACGEAYACALEELAGVEETRRNAQRQEIAELRRMVSELQHQKELLEIQLGIDGDSADARRSAAVAASCHDRFIEALLDENASLEVQDEVSSSQADPSDPAVMAAEESEFGSIDVGAESGAEVASSDVFEHFAPLLLSQGELHTREEAQDVESLGEINIDDSSMTLTPSIFDFGAALSHFKLERAVPDVGVASNSDNTDAAKAA